ncbi:MAG TPA: aldehyde dehydrogenase family protein [Pyrinomonadaceae bacterium]|nr:aldehyde dehydrogenase family protein [Pyrinomonadaceae bacterium]
MLHIPILRQGSPYKSLDVARVPHHRTRETFVEVSQANAGLIRRDLSRQEIARASLSKFTTRDLVDICSRAAEYFTNDTLPLGDTAQTAEDYVAQVSATTGMPYFLARRNMSKIQSMLANMKSVLNGLTRNIDWEILDRGFGVRDGRSLSFFPRTQSLGAVLPNNSPGVHSLWIPSFALRIPLVLKPGSAEPWTPYRIIQALIKAGAPSEAFSFYPADHGGAGEILRNCGRSLLFGDSSTTGPWANDPRVEIHGPGYSKVIIGEDCVEDWHKYIGVIAASIADNGGRSCVNASAVWTPKYAEEISESLAHRLAQILPRAADDEDARIAPFVDPNVATRINTIIDSGLNEPGASDVTAIYRKGERLVSWNNCSYMLPTIIAAELDHPLASKEFLFPYAAVVKVDQERIADVIPPSLVVTAITKDPKLIQTLVDSPRVDRLNIGALPTNQVSWDQPHEGNLFEHLYGRRAFQTKVVA